MTISVSHAKTGRQVNWDLLRIICMFLVVVCHTSSNIGSCRGLVAGAIAGDAALLCDPIFFSLSGFFAIRPLKESYLKYLIRKMIAIVIPIGIYSLVVYAWLYFAGGAELSFRAYFGWLLSMLSGPWWFIPSLIPMLVTAPFLYFFFSKLDFEQKKLLSKAVAILVLLGIGYTVVSSLADSHQHSTIVAAIACVQKVLPPTLMIGGYSLYFSLGYFIREDMLVRDLSQYRHLILFGIIGWLLGAFAIQWGYKRADPSFLWFFATIAFFLIFGKVHISSGVIRNSISYIAKRCYSIYLLQSTVIAFVVEKSVVSAVLINLAFIPRFALWFAVTFLCWLISLALAAIIDELVLKPFQKLLTCLISHLDNFS